MLNKVDEEDFNLWTEQIAIAINIDEMDWDNWLEEIDNMSKSEQRSLKSYWERFQELKVDLHKMVRH
jgi:hypothetical protein